MYAGLGETAAAAFFAIWADAALEALDGKLILYPNAEGIYDRLGEEQVREMLDVIGRSMGFEVSV